MGFVLLYPILIGVAILYCFKLNYSRQLAKVASAHFFTFAVLQRKMPDIFNRINPLKTSGMVGRFYLKFKITELSVP